MIYAALSSSALLGADIKKVLETAVEAGVQGIEWTDDGFVEPGAVDVARDTMMATLRARLCTVSYAPLYRACTHGRSAFDRVLSTARDLNAPLLRLWSAPRGGSPAEDAAAFLDEARFLGDEAGKHGVTLCFGLSPGSVLDSSRTARAIFSELDHPFVKMAWEPAPGARFDDLMDSILQLSGRIGLFVVRGEDLGGTADERSEEWLQYLDAYDEQGGSPDMARHVVVRTMAGGIAGLAACVSSIKEWSVTLRRYHQRRVY